MRAIITLHEEDNPAFTIKPNEQIKIGRDTTNDIQIKSSTSVSREHAVILFVENNLYIISYGKNGTLINNSFIKNESRYQLRKGDKIRLSEDGPELSVSELIIKEKKLLNNNIFVYSLISIVFIAVIIFTIFKLNEIDKNTSAEIEYYQVQLDEQRQKTAQLEDEIESIKITNQSTIDNLNNQISNLIESRDNNNQNNNEMIGENFPDKVLDSIYLVAAADRNNNIFGIGSSFAITSNGYLCTNYHVVENAIYIYLKYNDSYLNASLVHYDKNVDIVIIKVNMRTQYLNMRTPSKSDIGDTVYTIGYPWAYMTGGTPTVTKGTLSGFTENNTYLITDAAINKGNSGGPIIDINGNVLGINTFIIRGDDIEGGGFAINISIVKELGDSYGW